MGKKFLKLALLQLFAGDSLNEQLEKGKEACRRAKEMGADLALFPEMWSNGYQIPQEAEVLEKQAISADSEFIREFAALSAELEMAIGITFLETHQPKPLNSMILFDRKGKAVLHYSKVHICAFDLEKMLSAGDGFHTAALDIGGDVIQVGCMICFDREFPESARILMLKGAEIVLAPNACPMEINRLAQLRSRAFENMLAIATCNYPASVPDCNGGSTVFDGMAYLPEVEGSRDTCLLQAGEAEEICLADLDLAKLRRYRETEMMGDAYRRPQKYGRLVEDECRPPFVRQPPRR